MLYIVSVNETKIYVYNVLRFCFTTAYGKQRRIMIHVLVTVYYTNNTVQSRCPIVDKV